MLQDRSFGLKGLTSLHWQTSLQNKVMQLACLIEQASVDWIHRPICLLYGVFTLPDIDTDTDTDKKWSIKNCMEVFILSDTDTNTETDSIGLQTHFVGVGIGVGVGQCEHTTTSACNGVFTLLDS